MGRRGQSLVEFSICLPFLILIMGAMAEFGLFLHRRQVLWGVARAGGLELVRSSNQIGPSELSRIRRQMLFLGNTVDLELGNIRVGPISGQPGFYQVSLETKHLGVTSFDWLGGPGGKVRVRLVVPVEGAQ